MKLQQHWLPVGGGGEPNFMKLLKTDWTADVENIYCHSCCRAWY